MATKKSSSRKNSKKAKLSAKKIINNAKSRLGGEEFKVEGKKVVTRVKQLIKEGNVRQIIVKNNKGKVIFSLPVTAGVVGAVLLPPLAVLGALAAMLTECSIQVVRGK